ncbi:MAG: hypothetical protein P8Q92_08830 [Pseudoprimorskyibacter sp.]|jgi:hypothetical protein|nr:hypothetical protein [Pseudoprimorskyibacter sp.]
MIPRLIILVVLAGAVGTSGYLSWLGVGGESSNVVSARTGSSGVGYIRAGGVK